MVARLFLIRYYMNLFLTGLCLVIGSVLFSIIVNPVGGISTAIKGLMKYVGIGLVVIGAFQWITEDEEDSRPSPSGYEYQPEVNDDEGIEAEPSSSEEAGEISAPVNAYLVSNYPIIESPSSDIEDLPTREPRRDPCIACKNTGVCPVCDGTGQTKDFLVVRDDGLDTEYRQCKFCGGSTLCSGCGGDGWLDEGVDF